MLGAFANAFRTPDLRRKLLFVLLIIVVFRLGSQIPAPGVNVANVQSCIDVAGQRRLQADQPVLRRRAPPADDLRARDHAVHHGEHHPAAARGRDPAAGGPQEGGPGRPDQDHPVHPLPHPRRWRSCRPPASWRWPAPASSCRTATLPLLHNDNISTFLVMVITMTAGTAVIMWLGELITDRGIGNGMSILIFTQVVATFPSSLWGVQRSRGWWTFAHRDGDRSDHRGRGHLHRAGAAPDPGAVRPPHGRPQDVRRQLDVHPAQGEPGRHHPGHLRLVAALPAGDGGPVQPEQEPAAAVGGLAQRPTSSAAATRSTWWPTSC